MKKLLLVLIMAVAVSLVCAYFVQADNVAGTTQRAGSKEGGKCWGERCKQPLVEKAPCASKAEKCEEKCNKFTFDATDSYDPNNTKLSYLWDFGDGTTSTDPVVTHVFEKAGEYRVTLSVKNAACPGCDSATTSYTVKANTPPAAVFVGPETACTGQTVTFDASASTDNTPENLSYRWNFGDGTTGEGKTVTKTYAKGGTYKVGLTVDDGAGSICSTACASKTICVNGMPVADAGNDIDMCAGCSGEYRVTLDASKSRDPDGDALTYAWDFGDGESAVGKTVSHVYKKAGVYTATLLVDDGRKTSCSACVDKVNVTLNTQPTADAGEDIYTCVDTSVTLDGSKSVGSGLKYMWDLGDGTTADGVKVTHSYVKGGVYRPILTVDDGKGTKCSRSSSGTSVMVNSAPKAFLKKDQIACAGATLSFDACGTFDPDGDELEYVWDFGDGTVEKGGMRASHTFTKGGEYTVRVGVDDKKNTPCSTSCAGVHVKINTPPVADAKGINVCCVGTENTFDGSGSTGSNLKYMWNFGDGTTAEGMRVTHAYAKRGKYTVTLRVDDGSGSSCSTSVDSFGVVVNDSPVPIIKCK